MVARRLCRTAFSLLLCCEMKKQIYIIWLLSLLSALLLIGVQGYWLYDQYVLAVDTTARRLAAQVLATGEEEYALRKASMPSDFTYTVHRTTDYRHAGGDDSRASGVSFSFSKTDTLALKGKRMQFSFPAGLAEDSLYRQIYQAFLDGYIPFQLRRMDSLLHIALPAVSFTVGELPSGDTLHTVSEWRLGGTRFHPLVEVIYVHNPLAHKGAVVSFPVPASPVLKQMGVQLSLSVGLIFLLIGCLVFQMRTIWVQKKLGELRQEFVQTLVHELKRPVQTLKMCLSFLADPGMRTDAAATEEVVHDSMFELDTLSAYLHKLKEMVQVEGRPTLLHRSAVDVPELVGKVIRLTNRPPEKTIRFTTAFSSELPLIFADPVHLANVLSNLIENALKYSGPEVNIEVSAVCREKEMELRVSDDGYGIAPEEQKRVFDLFYRSPRFADRQIPGLGLGLSYVRQIAEAHGGRMGLWSAPGGGTRITVYLPLGYASDKSDA